MILPLLLSTYILVATATTLRCDETGCHPVRGATASVRHVVALLPTLDACLVQQQRMPQVSMPVTSAGRQGITFQKHFTYLCQKGE